MGRLLLTVFLVIYAVIATYFAWQYFSEPSLQMCIDYPKAKLYSQIPQVIYQVQQTDENGDNKTVTGVKGKLGETVQQAKQLVQLTKNLSAELDLTEKNLLATGEAEIDVQTDQPVSVQNKVVNLGQYLYCQDVVKKYETTHPNINQILHPNSAESQ